jgi:hypothetical protein
MKPAAMLAAVLVLPPAPRQEPAQDRPEFDRFLFFAVLEGLMEDGVSDEAVRRILETDPKGAYVNFVYSCPVCHPVVEAFRVYGKRHDWYHGRKGDPYLGKALPGDLAAALASPERSKVRGGLQKLVTRYVEGHLKRLRLTQEEASRRRAAIEDGRKKGMGMLQLLPVPEMKECPSCEGAFAADPFR